MMAAASQAPMMADTPHTADSTRTTPLQVGINTFVSWRDWPVRGALMDEVRATGAKWIRIDVGWCSLEEAGEGRISKWYQDRIDAIVADAAARRLRIMATVGCTPTWLGARDYSSLPPDSKQYERAMTYLATRYRNRIHAWEIWNEPDCIGGCPNGSPTRYVPVLQAGYRAVKRSDPAATVVSGGVSGINLAWIEQMYRAGAKGYFDVLGVHPYLSPADAAPSSPTTGTPYRMSETPNLRALMLSHGDAKPVWYTEFGWTTGSDGGSHIGVSETTQASYAKQALALIAKDYPYVENVFWFTIRDRDDSSSYENGFGLLRLDGSRRPAFYSFKEGIRAIQDQRG